MNRILNKLLLIAFLFCFTNGFSQSRNTAERPKLVVGIVVDQMRWDYLYKYYDRYEEGGFKRMLREGFSAENLLIPYIPTYTAIGHSTVYTGSVPSIHGIAGNDFVMRSTQTPMYCTQDDSVLGVGIDSENIHGKMSPKNLLTTTVTDELKLATDFKSKVVGISLKDRGAILPAGHFADAAYWSVDGNWISSSFYMSELPSYVKKFNDKNVVQEYLSGDWDLYAPKEEYMNRVPDENPYEAPFEKDQKVNFPIDLKQLSKKQGLDLIKGTPFGNTYTLDFAKVIMENERMGNNPAGVPDFLAISLSSTDYIGHRFGINSYKIEDTYIRLDRDLADFFSYLDTQVGKGNYTVFLTADHGAAHNPQFIIDEKGEGGYFRTGEVRNALNDLLEKKFGYKKMIYKIMNYQVFLNNKIIKEHKLDQSKVKAAVVEYLRQTEGVAYAADFETIFQSNIPEPIKTMAINGYNRSRSGDVQYILEPQWFGASGKGQGTTHGAWNPYDSHIPAVFMGWGIHPGRTFSPTYMTDIAPTISALLHIQMPNGNIGNPIPGIFE